MIDKNILEEAEEFARSQIKERLSQDIRYHNIDHIAFVVSNATQLAEIAELSEKDKLLVQISAWFHDLGFIINAKDHENIGAGMAREFLLSKNCEEADIAIVEKLIISTRYDVEPVTLLEKILNDADSAHLGRKSYFTRSEKLREEWETLEGKEISEESWLEMNEEFIAKHQYYTAAGKLLYGEQKAKNLKRLEKMKSDENKKPKKKDKTTGMKPDRGVETMFRVTLKNHIQLSQIADNKANIMLSINAIIISIILTSLLPKLDKNAYLIWPSVLLLTVCIVSIVFATISTIPKVTKNRINRASIEDKTANLLFFGNFQGMNLKDFDWGMNLMMRDADYLYGSMIKDLYFLGKVLYKKYKYLRFCYVVFMVGIILSVIAYLVSMAIAFKDMPL